MSENTEFYCYLVWYDSGITEILWDIDVDPEKVFSEKKHGVVTSFEMVVSEEQFEAITTLDLYGDINFVSVGA
jgi:hypothetical protein